MIIQCYDDFAPTSPGSPIIVKRKFWEIVKYEIIDDFPAYNLKI